MRNLTKYLRVSLINQCNLACSYCKPETSDISFEKRTSPEKFYRSIRLLHQIGIRKIRFTGGEPTLYKELTQLVEQTKLLSDDTQVALTSNGLLLDRLAKPLAKAGLDNVNISLDTVVRAKFAQITGSDSLSKVITGINTAVEHIPKVKLNCVVMAGVNDMEASSMIQFADSFGIDIRFIEFMPTKHGRRNNHLFVSGETIRASLPFDLREIDGELFTAARYFRSDQLGIKIGFIDPVSHSFCAHCDRIRLSSEGCLYGCLFSGRNFNLFDTLEEGANKAIQQVRNLVAAKEFLGCSVTKNKPDDLPSFINIGG